MGRKITIDSATLFNKGLEMIEAKWLFDVPMDKIEVVVHPQSIVHSMVEFADNSVIAQLSHSDMCFPIQYAVTWPDRVPNNLKPLDFAQVGALHFEAPRVDDFPALNLARHAGSIGGTLPAVLNAANEVAVDAFLNGKINFPGIWQTVERVMTAHQVVAHPSLEELIEADAWARRIAAISL
jgi:1-deoxy-D-xylulose-5-phosphate reductoisomerase